jgi:outer membrane immunogenic protein
MTSISAASEFKNRPERRLSVAGAFAALTLALAGGTPSLAHAQSAPDLAQVMETVQRLEARVDTLEGDYKRAKQDAAEARAELQALRKKAAIAPTEPNKPAAVVATTPPAKTPLIHLSDTPTELYSMATKARQIPSDWGWGGFYAGAAFGMSFMHAKENFSQTQNLANTTADPGLHIATTGITTTSQSFSGQTLGAVSGLSLGYNYIVDSKSIVGALVEGGLTDTHVNLKGSGIMTTVQTSVTTPPGGAAGTTSLTNTSANTELSDLLENHWLASFLLRGGRLIDANDYIYLLGGYTYGRFQAEGQSFGLNGGTVGAGWERQIAPGWTLKAEYRYTRFQDKDLVSSTQITNVQSSSGGGSFTDNTLVLGDAHFSDVDMHSVWMGVSHYFGNF